MNGLKIPAQDGKAVAMAKDRRMKLDLSISARSTVLAFAACRAETFNAAKA